MRKKKIVFSSFSLWVVEKGFTTLMLNFYQNYICLGSGRPSVVTTFQVLLLLVGLPFTSAATLAFSPLARLFLVSLIDMSY
jgi:hypothetical protein